MPIGARPSGSVAIGPSITPVGIPTGTGADGDATGPAVAGYFTDFRTEVIVTQEGIASLPAAGPGQFLEVERVTIIDGTGIDQVVLTTAEAAELPHITIPMLDAITPTGTPGSIYVLDCAAPIRVPSGLTLRIIAFDASWAVDTGALMGCTVQYRVLSIGAL